MDKEKQIDELAKAMCGKLVAGLRHFIGCEINPQWHKVACDRLDGIDAGGQQSFFLR